MKRRQRRPILNLNNEQTELSKKQWQSKSQFSSDKYQQIATEHSEQNGSPSNPLANLLGQYNSDSDTEENSKTNCNKLDDKVNDFFKEIQMIAPEKTKIEVVGAPQPSRSTPQTLWQECFDESTGYPYYWHLETNEVTWEMPEEFKLAKESSETNPKTSQARAPNWPGFQANMYSQLQTNIPEGMIPKEVVARNRNRQIGNQGKSVDPTDPKNASKPSRSKADESDEGKIEMITSFVDETDSEVSDSDSPVKDKQKLSTGVTKSKPQKLTFNPNNDRGEKVEMGPSLPENLNIPSSSTKLEEQRTKLSLEKHSTGPTTRNDNELDALKNNGAERRTVRMERDDSSGSKLDVVSSAKISLVPGYGDDSDGEEDAVAKSPVDKPLFPISQYQETRSVYMTEPKVETKKITSGSIRIFDYRSGESSQEQQNGSSEKTLSEEVKTGEETEIRDGDNAIEKEEQEQVKPNKFLDDIETPAKAFQRKKRIAFDVTVAKSISPTSTTAAKVDEPVVSQVSDETDKEAKSQGETCEDKKESEREEPKETKTLAPGKSKMNFVKGETINEEKQKDEVKEEESSKNRDEIKGLIDLTLEKLKFLSEGSQAMSAVQIMSVQLQTLLTAWESGDLKEMYLHKWIVATDRDLGRLEEAAAPPGWACQWDRSQKRYYYRNVTTGVAQWTYPEVDVTGGTEEMEICTTPPPAEEEPSIIETNAEVQKIMEGGSTVDGENSSDERKNLMSQETVGLTAPPPPKISNPSPPPPPRIYPEDLKKGQKRRGSNDSQEKVQKREKLDKDVKQSVNPPLPTTPPKAAQPPLPPSSPAVAAPPCTEPLPPGVDSPEIQYAISASAMEPSVLYAAASQQTNPIYAATIGNPLISQATLMQGQLLHYPTYHQHLHNQALLAAANRLATPESVQFVLAADYTPIYANSQVIAKPPVKTSRESLGSALDSFYSDIASLEKGATEQDIEQKDAVQTESVPSPLPQVQAEIEQNSTIPDGSKDKKKKKPKLGINKKHKEMSSMVAKWQKAQQNLDDS